MGEITKQRLPGRKPGRKYVYYQSGRHLHSNFGGVVGRGHFDYVEPHQVSSFYQCNDAISQFLLMKAANLRYSGAGGIDGVHHVNVEGDV